MMDELINKVAEKTGLSLKRPSLPQAPVSYLAHDVIAFVAALCQ
jgi:hypothetical protein